MNRLEMRPRYLVLVAIAALVIVGLVWLQRLVEREEPSRPTVEVEPAMEPDTEPDTGHDEAAQIETAPDAGPVVEAVTRPEPGPDPRPEWPGTDLSDEERRDLEIVQKMDDISLLYDRSDYAAVVTQGKALLEESPGNARILGAIVPSSCILGDEETAREYYGRIVTPTERKNSEIVCRQHGIDLTGD